MKSNVLEFIVSACVIILLQSCVSPVVRKYHFPQIGLYMTITFDSDYGYALLSRDSSITTLSEEVDYIRLQPFESTSIGLFSNPEQPDTIFVDNDMENVFINSKKITFIPIQSPDPQFFDKEIVSGGVTTFLPRADFYDIGICDYMDVVYFREAGVGKNYIIVKPYK